MAASIKNDCFFDKCDSGKDIDCARCGTLSPCPKRVLIECGTPGSTIEIITTGQTINTSLITVDTSWFIKPVVDIHFSSQVNVILQPDNGITPPGTAEVVLQYDLIRRPDGRRNLVVGSWTYRRLITATGTTSSQRLETTDTFSFNKCLFLKPCQGCIDYFVRITAIRISVNNVII